MFLEAVNEGGSKNTDAIVPSTVAETSLSEAKIKRGCISITLTPLNNLETAGGGGGDKAVFFPPMTAVVLKSEVLTRERNASPSPKKTNSRMASCLEVDLVHSYHSSTALKQGLSGNQTTVKHLNIFSKY